MAVPRGGPRPRDVVVCLVSDTFTDAQRRGFYSTADQTLLSLVASPLVGKILVVDHPRGVLSQVKRRTRGDHPARRSGKFRGVRPLSLTSEVPRDEAAARRRYEAFDLQIDAAAVRHGLRNPFVLTFNLLHAGFGRTRPAADTAFYAQDDELEIPRLAPHRSLLSRAYRNAAERQGKVVAVTAELLDRFSAGGLVIPNGVDPALWRTAPPAVAAAGSAERAVYAGTIDSRVDADAFFQLADAGFEVELAGPVPDAQVRERLAVHPRITLLGSLDRPAVVDLLRSADVCVLAHRRTRLTEAMSPLKLFEYRASGAPVIATDLPGTREAWPGGLLVSPGGDYVAAARRAVTVGRLAEPARRALVEELSWRRRHEPLLQLLTAAEDAGAAQ